MADRSDYVWLPDESGMGGDWVPLGRPHFDPDYGRWLVQINENQARIATPEEMTALSEEAS